MASSGVAQWLACWAHNPKVRGSKSRSATQVSRWRHLQRARQSPRTSAGSTRQSPCHRPIRKATSEGYAWDHDAGRAARRKDQLVQSNYIRSNTNVRRTSFDKSYSKPFALHLLSSEYGKAAIRYQIKPCRNRFCVNHVYSRVVLTNYIRKPFV